MSKEEKAKIKQMEKTIKAKRKLARLQAEISRIEAGDYKRLTTSKLVLFVVLVISFIVDGVIIYGWFSGLEESSSLIIANEGVKGIVIGFYEWKAKNENCARSNNYTGESAYTEDEEVAG